MPFDAMKGLQEALRDREERHSRVEKREISEEMMEQNSYRLQHVMKGTKIRISYYSAFHEIERDGIVTELNLHFKYLKLDGERILFQDIYEIMITDQPRL
jgi:hypothetical protein